MAAKALETQERQESWITDQKLMQGRALNIRFCLRFLGLLTLSRCPSVLFWFDPYQERVEHKLCALLGLKLLTRTHVHAHMCTHVPSKDHLKSFILHKALLTFSTVSDVLVLWTLSAPNSLWHAHWCLTELSSLLPFHTRVVVLLRQALWGEGQVHPSFQKL